MMQRKQLVEEFCDRIKLDFDCFREEFDRKNSRDHFITFLIDHELISSKKIKEYTILQIFNSTQLGEKNKTQVVRELAKRFNLSTRSLWYILRKGQA